MSYIEVEYPEEKPAFYAMLLEQLALYLAGEPDRTARLSNASAVLAQAFPQANWVGFYLVDGDSLVLGPFQGRPAVSRIGLGRACAARPGSSGKPRWWRRSAVFRAISPAI